MPYVTRNPEGRIIALHADRNGTAQEELAADHPDLLSFVGTHVRLAEIRGELEATDLELVRVIEDLIAVLVDNGILALTDLPAAARDKLARRIKLRNQRDAQFDPLCESGGETDEVLPP